VLLLAFKTFGAGPACLVSCPSCTGGSLSIPLTGSWEPDSDLQGERSGWGGGSPGSQQRGSAGWSGGESRHCWHLSVASL